MTRKPRGLRRPPRANTNRSSTPFAALHKELHPKSRWEYLDMDYINDLSDEEKAVLAKFIDEYYGASLAPADNPESWDKDFHDNQELRKDCMDRNNARNRDLYSILRTRGMVEETQIHDGTIEGAEESQFQVEMGSLRQNLDYGHQEDVLNELIDRNDQKVASADKAKSRVRATRVKRRPKSPE
jgi:hypothetical protein